MGYYISQREADFTIKKENFPAVLKIIKGLELGGWCTDIPKNADIKEAFECWRWEVDYDSHGNISSIYFTGEKHSGDEEGFLKAIAPYVEAGSYIEMSGEEGEIWRWVFDGHNCEEVTAGLDWEDNIQIVEDILEQKEILPTLIGINKKLDQRIAKVLKGE